MSRKTNENLRLADEMAEAGINPFWVERVRSMLRGYIQLRTTCSRLHGDNMVLRDKLGLPHLVPAEKKDPKP